LLFVYTVRKAGVAEITSGLRPVGAGFLILIALTGIRQCARTLAWIKCLEAPYRLRFRDAFAARVMGDALGTSYSRQPGGERAVESRLRERSGAADDWLVAIAIENIFYSLSVVLFIFSGTTALLLTFTLPKPLRYAAIATLLASLVIAPLAFLVIRQRWKFLSGSFILWAVRVKRNWVENSIARAKTLEDRVYGFYDRNRAHFLSILALEFCFHLAGVAEVYTTLSFVSDTIAPTLFTAFILEFCQSCH